MNRKVDLQALLLLASTDRSATTLVSLTEHVLIVSQITFQSPRFIVKITFIYHYH